MRNPDPVPPRSTAYRMGMQEERVNILNHLEENPVNQHFGLENPMWMELGKQSCRSTDNILYFLFKAV
jgi:hypothetical protein